MTQIKLPPVNTFASTDKTISPFNVFHRWVADQFGGLPAGKKIRVDASALVPQDFKELAEVVKTWMKKCVGIPKTKIALDFSWLNLNIGPKELKEGEAGFVYVDEAKLFECTQENESSSLNVRKQHEG